MKRFLTRTIVVLLVLALATLLCGCDDGTGVKPPEIKPYAQNELWNRISGVYVALDEPDYGWFLMMSKDGEAYLVTEGILNSGYARGGASTLFEALSTEKYKIEILCPATEGNEMDDPLPEQRMSFVFDINELSDKRISVQKDGGTAVVYTYCGATIDEAYEGIVKDRLTEADLLLHITGVWANDEEMGDYYGYFYCFGETVENEYGNFVYGGLLASGYAFGGYATEFEAMGDYVYRLSVFCPAVPENEMNDAIPERSFELYVDIRDYKSSVIYIGDSADDAGVLFRYYGATVFEASDEFYA